MNSGESVKRMHVLYKGRVQGVGFRYTVCSLAESFSVTGFVRNLWDGDVELIAEGTEEELVGLLHEIRNSRLGRGIINEHFNWKDATGEFDRFGISF